LITEMQYAQAFSLIEHEYQESPFFVRQAVELGAILLEWNAPTSILELQQFIDVSIYHNTGSHNTTSVHPIRVPMYQSIYCKNLSTSKIYLKIQKSIPHSDLPLVYHNNIMSIYRNMFGAIYWYMS